MNPLSLSLKLSIFSALAIIFSLMSVPSHAQSFSCPASDSWITNPSMPVEVKKSNPDGTSNFCDFYQFSWQSFLYLVSPAPDSSELRNYQVTENYPVLEVSDTSSQPANSCDATISNTTLFVRTQKDEASDTAFVLPKSIGQAGDGAVIYDQNKNVVFYEVRFSRNLCDIGTIQSQSNFPSGTAELKMAWKVLTGDEEEQFFTIEADIDGVEGLETVGLIGFHHTIATTDHPEFVWATFEHKSNAPDCTNPQPIPAGGWSFTSEQCASTLTSANAKSDAGQCKFNHAIKATKLTGPPTEICRVYAYGTDTSDPNATQNLDDIQDINSQLVGEGGYLTTLDSSNPMAVFKNYFIVGGLWESDIKKPSSDISNQRGSLRLANTVAETTFQDVNLTAGFVSNCFGCHNYEVSQSNTLPSASLSHTFDDVMEGQCSARDVQAGPIWSNIDAQTKCVATCKSRGGWNGQWTTTIPGKMSVCGCCGD